MAKPKTEIKEKDYYKDIYFLYEIFNGLKNIDEVKIFLKDILTRSELRMLKRRWHVANLLMQGLDVRSVARKSKTSTQTVSRIKKVFEEGHGGLLLAIKRVSKTIEKEREGKISGGSKFMKGWFK